MPSIGLLIIITYLTCTHNKNGIFRPFQTVITDLAAAIFHRLLNAPVPRWSCVAARLRNNNIIYEGEAYIFI